MEDSIVLNEQDAYLFLVSAVRYALGRRSYIIGWTCQQVRLIAPKLAIYHREVIARDIRSCKDYGGESHKQDWLTIAQWLEKLNEPELMSH